MFIQTYFHGTLSYLATPLKFLDLSGLGFADDDEVNQSRTLSPDPDKADFEDPELLAIAEKLKELENQSDSDESRKSGDWLHA